MLFTEIITVHCENCAKIKCTVWEICWVSEMMKEMEHSNHCALLSYKPPLTDVINNSYICGYSFKL